MGEILTLTETARMLRMSKQTVVSKINEGKLKAKNIGGEKKPEYRIKLDWVNEYLEGGNK